MIYPNVTNCQQCGKRMVQLRETKVYCKPKCRQLAFRLRNNLPLTWKPDPTKRKVLLGGAVTAINWDKGKGGDQFTSHILETKHGLRKVYINEVTSEIHVFAIQDGKEVLIK